MTLLRILAALAAWQLFCWGFALTRPFDGSIARCALIEMTISLIAGTVIALAVFAIIGPLLFGAP